MLPPLRDQVVISKGLPRCPRAQAVKMFLQRLPNYFYNLSILFLRDGYGNFFTPLFC